MKKYAVMLLGATVAMSGCGVGNENAASGGILGAQFGSIIGSAIGGIGGGPRGSDIGTLVGMAGGAVAGAAIGGVADRAQQHRYADRAADRAQYAPAVVADAPDGGFDPGNGGDDVIDFDGAIPSQPSLRVGTETPSPAPELEIRSVRFAGSGGDMAIRPDEMAKVVVEVYNNSGRSLYNVQPRVEETTGNRHIAVSAPITVEKIAPGMGIRYTAMVKTDRRLKDGTAHFRVTAVEKSGKTQSAPSEFSVHTMR